MEAYQERVTAEKSEIIEKLDKLDQFMSSSRFITVSPVEKARLIRQHLIMQLYEQVLSERVSAF